MASKAALKHSMKNTAFFHFAFLGYAKAREVAAICHCKVFYHKVAIFTSVTHTDKQNKTLDISEKIMVEIVVVVFAMQKHTDSDS